MSRRPKLAASIAGLVAQDRPDAYLDQALAPADETPRPVDPAQLRRSPYQPVGRPSSHAIQAVRDAIAAAGSLARLVGTDPTATEEEQAGAVGVLRTLEEDAQELVQLAADVATHRVREPLEARTVAPDAEGRTLELIAGHRRQAAALLAGEPTVPVRSLGTVPDARAAELVFRSNRLRENFTAWQEAVALAEVRDALTRERGEAPSTRALAELMGYALGRVSELLTFADRFRPILFDVGNGNAELAAERLARVSYAQLRGAWQRGKNSAPALASALRRAAKLPPPSLDPGTVSAAVEDLAPNTRPLITLTRPVDRLALDEAERLTTELSALSAQIRRRIKELRHAENDRPATRHHRRPTGRRKGGAPRRR